MDKLKKYNMICGAMHLVQAIVIFSLASLSDNLGAVTLPITSLFQNWDAGYPVQVLGLVTRITFIKWCSAFAFISAGAHFTVLLCWDRYSADLALGRNSFRWFEYSFSSSLIITLLYMQFGQFDIV